MSEAKLGLQEGPFPPVLFACFRGKHFLQAFTHPEPARLRVASFGKDGVVVEYREVPRPSGPQ